MKNTILIIACLIPVISMAQIKTSVADGGWSNPQTWSPVGVPASQSDSIIINHEVSVSENLDIETTLWIQEDGFLIAYETFALHGDLRVDGGIEADRLVVGDGADFSNYGYIEAETFITTNDLNSNFDVISTDSIFITEAFVNSSMGTIDCIELITASSSIENNGLISTESWIHNENITGTGAICIEDCFLNNGNINGSLDICDQTPAGSGGIPCDFNLGAIASTVTTCQNTFCGSPTAVLEEELTLEVKVYPNPINKGAALHIEVETNDVFHLTIIDVLGKVVHGEKLSNGITILETSTFRSGIYFATISNSTGDKYQRKIIVY
ncbi:T9SS type A sorting domain-containing protein [Cryomorpha ignava]|uniref:T9SS type A sorting domain-containing protein n=1 Tax=Cryomorpha ignava TaxID=101383 RepID=A0A7K3WT57_9FLAO|nr:T9SS type A sorting domain-containing protein [Cryomorpha ignava]NEN23845.1 T9SS type A sorting domain-containing protein [Cryomorpha ignava]